MEILTHLNELAGDASNSDLIAQCKSTLNTFLDENESMFMFSDIGTEEYDTVMNNCISILSSEHVLSIELLMFLKLLSRDRNLVQDMQDIDSTIKLFMNLYEKDCAVGTNEYICKVEVLKCLCNWIYHSKDVRDHFINNDIMKVMIKEIEGSTSKMQDDVFYQLRLMFLISALEAGERAKMLENGALAALIHVMEVALVNNEEKVDEAQIHKTLTEVLKALFNITMELTNVTSEHVSNDTQKLVSLLHQLLLTFYPFDHEAPDDLLTHIVNIFLNIPKDAISCLLTQSEEKEGGKMKMKKNKYRTVYQGYNMEAIIILVEALERRITIEDYTLMKEKCLTVLTGFSYICRINSLIRKYLKEEILPKLEVSDIRPENQTGLRGDIIRLMQTVDVPLKNMAADFLFVLCKENTTRLIRYAGYGNSAGFLASRGLMVPGIPYATEGDYSPDEQSDSEEENDIDPMTGATAIPSEDIFANLTESEKEQEIDNLIAMTNRLQKLNVIKPMAVKSDGQLVEISELDPDDIDSDD